MNYHCVYVVTNTTNDKQYVGMTSNLARRWSQHLRGAKSKKPRQALHAAMAKYGADKFTVCVKAEHSGDDSLAVCQAVEQATIATLKTKAPHGYNVTDGGEGFVGYVFTDADKSKISRALTGRKQSSAERVKRSAAMRASPNYEACLAALAEINTNETKKLKRAQAVAVSMRKPEVRAKLRAASAARIKQDAAAHAAQCSRAAKVLWSNDAAKADLVQKRKKYCNSDAGRARLSNQTKEAWQNKRKELLHARQVAPIKCVTTGEVFDSQYAAVRAFAARGVRLHQSSIARCCAGELKTTGGMQWCYAEQHGVLK